MFQDPGPLLDHPGPQLVGRLNAKLAEVELESATTMQPGEHANNSRAPTGRTYEVLKGKVLASLHLLQAEVNDKAEMWHSVCGHGHDLPVAQPRIIPAHVQRAKRFADRADHQ